MPVAFRKKKEEKLNGDQGLTVFLPLALILTFIYSKFRDRGRVLQPPGKNTQVYYSRCSGAAGD